MAQFPLNLVQRLPRNPVGRDLVIGDIHGHFSRVEAELERVNFDPSTDRLICVGDLVDRGPESPRALEWLQRPWFFSVMGNHDAAVLNRRGLLSSNFELFFDYHAWFDDLPEHRRAALCEALMAMPWALEVDTRDGLVGVVHGEVPEQAADWTQFLNALEHENMRVRAISGRHQARSSYDWNSRRAAETPPLPGVEWVIHGHTQRRGAHPGRLGNRLWIDTMGWYDKPLETGTPRFTLLDLDAPLEIL